MSPSELRSTLRRTRRIYHVRVTDGCSYYPDMLLDTPNRSRAERRHARYLRTGYPSKLTVTLN